MGLFADDDVSIDSFDQKYFNQSPGADDVNRFDSHFGIDSASEPVGPPAPPYYYQNTSSDDDSSSSSPSIAELNDYYEDTLYAGYSANANAYTALQNGIAEHLNTDRPSLYEPDVVEIAQARGIDYNSAVPIFNAREGHAGDIYASERASPVYEHVTLDFGRTEETVTPLRAAQIGTYVDDEIADAMAPMYAALETATALAGDSDLGELSRPEQRLLVDAALEGWSQQPDVTYTLEATHSLTHLSGDQYREKIDSSGGYVDPEVISESFIDRGLNTLRGADGDDVVAKHEAAGLVTNGLIVLTPEQQAATVNALGFQETSVVGPAGSGEVNVQTDAALLADALALDDQGYEGQRLFTAFFQDGVALSDRATVAANVTNALLDTSPDGLTRGGQDFVSAAFYRAHVDTYRESPEFANAMGDGLAMLRHAHDPADQQREGARIGGILNTEQGAELMGYSPNIDSQQRLSLIGLVDENVAWDAATFEASDSVWNNSEIMEAYAAPRVEAFLEGRGDAPIELSGTDLENTVGFALGLPPDVYDGNESAAVVVAREADAANGEHSYYEGDVSGEMVDRITQEIRAAGGDDPHVTVIPIQYSSDRAGVQELVIFRVEDQANPGEMHFVDATGAYFEDFADWKEDNQLPPGFMTYPSDGVLAFEAGGASPMNGGELALGSEATRATVDTWQEHALKWIDRGAMVGGIVAGGAIIIGSGGTAAPFVLGGATAWQVARTGERIADRIEHNRELSLADPGARRDWIEFGSGLVSMGALGATTRAAMLSTRATPLAQLSGAANTAMVLNRTATALDFATAVNDSYELITNWNELDPNQRSSLALSIGFWTAGTAAHARLGLETSSAAADPIDGGRLYNPESLRYRWLEAHSDNWRAGADGTTPPGQFDYRYTDTQPPIRAGHIVEGHIVFKENSANDRATGFHYRPDGQDPEWRRVTQETLPDANNVYEGRVAIWDPVTQAFVNKGKSSFFPPELSEVDVRNAILHAFADAGSPTAAGQQYEGASGLGFDIKFRTAIHDGDFVINSAYPVYQP